MRTRRQKAQQQEAGIPPTPPQQLPATTRSRRTQSSQSSVQNSSQPHPSTRSSTAATRGGRPTKRGRPATIAKAKAPRKADAEKRTPTAASATQKETTPQSDVSTKEDAAVESEDPRHSGVNMEDEMQEIECEIPDSIQPPLEDAHPVLGTVSRSENSPAAAPVAQGAETPQGPSQTSQLFLHILESPSEIPVDHASRMLQLPLGDSPSSEALSSPLSPRALGRLQEHFPIDSPYYRPPNDSPTVPSPVSQPYSYQTDYPPIQSHVQYPVPQESLALPMSFQETDPQAPRSQETAAFLSSCSSHTVRGPTASQAPIANVPDAFREVYNWPGDSESLDPSMDHTVLNLCLDGSIVEYFSQMYPDVDPHLSFAVPSIMLPDLLRFVAEHPLAQGSSLQTLLQDQPVANRLTSELTETNNADPDVPISDAQGEDSDLSTDTSTDISASDAVDDRNQLRDSYGTTQTMRLSDHQTFIDTPSRKNTRPAQQTPITPNVTTTSVSYDGQGNVVVGNTVVEENRENHEGRPTEYTSQLSMDVDDSFEQSSLLLSENSLVQSPAENQTQPETPQGSRWKLSNMLPSSRIISRFIPGVSQLASYTSPRRRAPNSDRLAQRTHQAQPTPLLLTRGEADRRRRAKEKSQRMRDRIKALEEEKARQDERIKRLEEEAQQNKHQLQEEARRNVRGVTETNPLGMRRAINDTGEDAEERPEPRTGEKRRRAPSPDVYPNPPGASYGLDDAIYGPSDSDEEETESRRTSTSNKRARTSLGDQGSTIIGRLDAVDRSNARPYIYVPGDRIVNEVVGDPRHATPYTKTMFAINVTPKDRSNVFEAPTSAMSEAENSIASPFTPASNPTMVFKVPSPTDSDGSDDERSPMTDVNKTPTPDTNSSPALLNTPTPAPITVQTQRSPLKPKLAQPTTEQQKATQQMPPPPRPILPRTAGIPTSTPTASAAEEIALAKLRQRALKHTPAQPSRLRESSENPGVTPPQPSMQVQRRAETSMSHTADEVAGGERNAHQTPPPELAEFQAYNEYQQTISARVTEFIEASWDSPRDDEVASSDFDVEFSLFKEQYEEESANATLTPTTASAASTIPSTSPNAQENFISPKVQAYIDSQWTEEDQRMAEEEFEAGFEAFVAAQNIETTA